jgi:hypothetical protein
MALNLVRDLIGMWRFRSRGQYAGGEYALRKRQRVPEPIDDREILESALY